MALEIIGPMIVPARADSDTVINYVIPSPPAVPPAPPLPKSFPVKVYRADVKGTAGASDNDSGHWSIKILGDDLPGCDLSDDEFSEEFSSASTSRRGSHGIPTPPPVPPLPSYLQHSISLQLLDADIPPELNRFDPENPYGIINDDDDSWYPDYDSTCTVCYEYTYNYSESRRRCCNSLICKDCMLNIVQAKIGDGVVQIECPNPDCDAPVGRQEILQYLTGEVKERYERMRLEVDGDGNRKACPNCSFITEHELPKLKLKKLREKDVKITCVRCDQEWCFNCHAPWHKDTTCKIFRKGDHLFQKWTKARSYTGVANCQKCPMCRVFIQRSTGCDHMTCNRCDTHFCYKCGGRFVVPGLGDHYDHLCVFGCAQNYKKDNPVQRKAVRGGYLGAKLAMLTGYPVLFAGGAAIVVAAGIVILPIYGGYRLYKFKKNTRRRRRRH